MHWGGYRPPNASHGATARVSWRALMQIEGAGALVAGGASGLGAATSRALAEAGAQVVVADLNAEKGEALASEIGATFVAADVTEAEAVGTAVKRAASAAGGLRVCVCCAGIGWAERVSHKGGPHNLEYFSNVVKVNLIGSFNVLRLFAERLATEAPIGEERGVAINTASVAAYEGQIGQIAYSASKGGIVGMTLPAARDLASLKIRVNTIAPGLFLTPLLMGLNEEARKSLGAQVPHPARLGDASEYGALAVHIVENPMLNGETIRLDGAIRMAPR